LHSPPLNFMSARFSRSSPTLTLELQYNPSLLFQQVLAHRAPFGSSCILLATTHLYQSQNYIRELALASAPVSTPSQALFSQSQSSSSSSLQQLLEKCCLPQATTFGPAGSRNSHSYFPQELSIWSCVLLQSLPIALFIY